MTKVYFIRHAQSDWNTKDDRTRPLTEKGSRDCALVTAFLRDKNIDVVLSSPYKRTIDTISEFADSINLPIQHIEDFRERNTGGWVDDFNAFAEKQWVDFSYKQTGGESLAEVQQRNIAALCNVLAQHKDKNIVIGTHGTALSTIINYYDKSYGYNDFLAMVDIMPWVVVMYFDGDTYTGLEKVDLFQ